ncbi:MAG: sigma-70 family RNA polymerase sigma factor [Verrucomicrobia bacterium]|nr:sigma-70 family RNA polymerase sigma factor [Verrucomicrobiota bacterium]
MKPSAEAELIARCRRGAPAAWDELFDLHYAAAGRFVFQLAPDFTREDVEEICQETFLSVIKNLGSFKGGSAFQTWLFRIAANKARDFREKQLAAKRGGGQVTVSLEAEDPETGLTIDPPSAAPGPDAQLLGAERAGELRAALDQLDAPCREIIELRYFGDLSYEEISVALDLNPKTVSSRLSKCLDKLEDLVRARMAREQAPVFPSNH